MIENKTHSKFDKKTLNLLMKLRIILEELLKEREKNSEINTKILNLDSLILEKEEEIKNLNIKKNELNSQLSIEISKSDIKKVNLNKVVNSIFTKEIDNSEKIKNLENKIEIYSKEKNEIEEKIKNENENFIKKKEEFENTIKNFENEKKKLQNEFEEEKIKQTNLLKEKKEIYFKLEEVQKIQTENENVLNEKREIEYHKNIKVYEDGINNFKTKNKNLEQILKNLENEIIISTEKIVNLKKEIDEKKLKEKSFIVKVFEKNLFKSDFVIKKLVFKKIDQTFEILIQSKETIKNKITFKTTEIIKMNFIDNFENDKENKYIYNIFYADEKTHNKKIFKFEIHPKLSEIFFETMRNFQIAALKADGTNDF